MTNEKNEGQDLTSSENSELPNVSENIEETVAEDKIPVVEVMEVTPTNASPVQKKQPAMLLKKWLGRLPQANWKIIGIGALCLAFGLFIGNLLDHGGKGDHRGFGGGGGDRFSHQQEFFGHR